MPSPFSALFGASVGLRNYLYDSGRFRARRLRGPVVSVGNISVGGAGKTPFVIMLGEMLKQRGIAFDVLSRGYRRKTHDVLEVDRAGTPSDYGDEPLLIARKLGIPVIVGESRHAAGVWSEQKFGPRLHLLDDGFQHRKLARDFDIVLLTEADLHERLLPAGRLREPLTSILRADAIVLPPEITEAKLWDRLPSAGSHPRPLLWRLRRTVHLDALRTPASSAVSVLAFCAIARPKRFFDDLRSNGIVLANEVAFRDHHSYIPSDISYLITKAQQSNATGFVTTEKDAINLGPLAARLQPLHIAHLRLELLDDASVLTTLLTRLHLA
jgi:tetraacyldisaccharide 4'-kinase